jgi:hypothetical protein
MSNSAVEHFDETEVNRKIQQFISDQKLIEYRWNSLVASHPNQWIAAFEGEIIIGPTYVELLSKLGTNAPSAAIRLIVQVPSI